MSVSKAGPFINIPSPYSFTLENVVPNVTVSGNLSQNIVLPPFIELSGTTRGDGLPLAGTSVHAYGTDVDCTAWASSDASGNYSLILCAGTHRLSVVPQVSTGFGPTLFTDVVLSEDTVMNLDLSPGFTVQGTAYVF